MVRRSPRTIQRDVREVDEKVRTWKRVWVYGCMGSYDDVLRLLGY